MFLPGVHRGGHQGAPNSEADKAARRSVGAPSCVIRLRFTGSFLPVHLIQRRPWPTGLFVSQQHEGGWWSASLHPFDGDLSPILRPLSDARVVKERDDGCLLVAGMEWDFGYLKRWPQTWLCGPDEEVARAALFDADRWLRSNYFGVG